MTAVIGVGVELLLLLLALPLLVAAAYLLLLALASFSRRAPPPPVAPVVRFDVVVPAHNEATGIAATVHSLLAVDYPTDVRRVTVVADNCHDDTAERALAAGARVLERHDTIRRGKGHALAYAFKRILSEGWADAVVVVDADTVVSRGLLRAFAARLAEGDAAVQAHYGVRNPDASWRTRLMRIALAMFHQLRSLARERLGVSCGLRGNGMCFTTSLLRQVPYDAFSLVEDLEFGIRLGREGVRVAYAPEAEVLGEMVAGERASRSQRARWEEGRAALVQSTGGPLVREAVQRRSGLLLDLALDLLLPPLSTVVVAAGAGLGASLVLLAVTGHGEVAGGLYGFALACLGVYVFAGWLHSGTGARGLLDLALAPGFIAWKMTLLLGKRAVRKPERWVRTTREGETRS